jgi:uncharacterized membrane protein YadS
VVGFVVLAVARSTGFVPDAAADGAKLVAGWLTIAAMAALGLSVDVRVVRAVGPRIVAAVGLSLIALVCLALALITALPAGTSSPR